LIDRERHEETVAPLGGSLPGTSMSEWITQCEKWRNGDEDAREREPASFTVAEVWGRLCYVRTPKISPNEWQALGLFGCIRCQTIRDTWGDYSQRCVGPVWTDRSSQVMRRTQFIWSPRTKISKICLH